MCINNINHQHYLSCYSMGFYGLNKHGSVALYNMEYYGTNNTHGGSRILMSTYQQPSYINKRTMKYKKYDCNKQHIRRITSRCVQLTNYMFNYVR